MKNLKNILIRDLTDQDRDMIAFVKRETGCNQASKALMQAGYAFCQRQNMIGAQAKMIRKLEEEIAFYRKNANVVAECLRKMDEMLSKKSDEIVD